MFYKRRIFLITVIVHWISVQLIDGKDISLTQTELRDQFGQENTTFNDGRSCFRVCDGQIRTCYYEFNAQFYDSMSALCGSCDNGTISDCFKTGCITANGMPRTVMSVNRQIPGPIISVCKNDRIIVDVTNGMGGQELTFHWHGLHQKESPWFDGVPMVTQCPIASGNSFRYVFNASEAGTHLYHAHSGVHRMNGLFGSLIVRESRDPNADLYDFDLNEHSIVLSDWNNALVENTLPGTKIQIVMPDSILFNEFGNYFDKQKNQSHAHTPMAVFYVERGKRHRFRISNIGGHFCPFELNIADHNLTVIATDGFSIEPIVVERIISLSGERYDVVLNAANDSNLNETLITVRGLGLCKFYNYKTQEFARIIFVDNLKDHKRPFEDYRPLKNRPVYELQDVLKITLNDIEMDCRNSSHYCVAALQQKRVGRKFEGENLRNQLAKVIELNYEITYVWHRPNDYISSSYRAMVSMTNKISSTHTSVPGLLQDDSSVAYCNAEHLPNEYDIDIVTGGRVYYCPHSIHLELGELYEIVLIDNEFGNPGVSHSLHLHGYAFQVIDMGSREEYENGNSAFANATHLPVIKDTITIPRGGFVKFRFRATNPGYWLFHCHLEFHSSTGMKLIFKVGNSTDIKSPPANFPTCGNFLTPVY